MRYEIRPLTAWADPETDPRRGSHLFRASWAGTLDLLGSETEKLGASLVVLQVGVQEGDIRLDGMLRANAKVSHPGAVVSFESDIGPLRYATDTYEQQIRSALPGWQANVRAIALALEALRAVDRYGVTKRREQYAGWRAIAAPAPLFAGVTEAAGWMRKYAALTLELGSAVNGDGAVNWASLYRAMAKRMHPDNGSPRADWDRLDAARRLLEKEGWL